MKYLISILTTTFFMAIFSASSASAQITTSEPEHTRFVCDQVVATGARFNCRYEEIEETKFCRFMRQPSESELKIRDTTRSLCQEAFVDVCSMRCMEIHLESTAYKTGHLASEGFQYLEEGARKGAEIAKPYWMRIKEGWEDGKKD
jgi:hypothetical protein